jgi:hypothetical protein
MVIFVEPQKLKDDQGLDQVSIGNDIRRSLLMSYFYVCN